MDDDAEERSADASPLSRKMFGFNKPEDNKRNAYKTTRDDVNVFRSEAIAL